MWPLQIVTAARRCSHSHHQKQKLAAREPAVHWVSQRFCLPNIPDLNTANLPSVVLFNRRSAIIRVSPQLTKLRERLSKAWQKLPHGAVIANLSLLSPFYLRLMLFARWRHYFPRLIQIFYSMMFRLKRTWLVPNLVKICSIFLKL